MRLPTVGQYRGVLELVAEALRLAGPRFPDLNVTGFLREVFEADFAGAGTVDLRGMASRTWADSPAPISVGPGGFHTYAAAHPLTRAYQRNHSPIPLRLSDLPATRRPVPAYGGTGMSHVLVIPLAIAPHRVSAIALLRAGLDFSAADVQLAGQLQPILGGLYAIRARLTPCHPGPVGADTGIPITERELAVLNLIADGLIAAAIARELGISPRTVSKHIESIYRKLGTHDRVSTVLRAQALRLLAPGQEPPGSIEELDWPARGPGRGARRQENRGSGHRAQRYLPREP